MRGHAHTGSIASQGDKLRNTDLTLQHQGQWTGPEGRCEPRCQFGNFSRHLTQLFKTGDMDDQRVIGRAAFGGIDTLDGFWIQRIRPQTVNCLGRESNQSTSFENSGGVLDNFSNRML